MFRYVVITLMIFFDILCTLAILYCIFPIFNTRITIDIAFNIFFVTIISFIVSLIILMILNENKPVSNCEEG